MKAYFKFFLLNKLSSYGFCPQYRSSLLLTLLVSFTSICVAGDNNVAAEIRKEATKLSQDPEGYALPLMAHWITGAHVAARGWAPDKQIELIEQGHYILPWLAHPGVNSPDFPFSESQFIADYQGSVLRARELGLSLVFCESVGEHST